VVAIHIDVTNTAPNI